MMADQLDHALQRFGAGIAEEHEVRKALVAEARGKLLAVRALKQVRHMPELGRLLLQRLDQRGVGMAERIHRHARGEIEIAIAIGRDQPAALAALETEVGSGENGEQMRGCAIRHDGHLNVADGVVCIAQRTIHRPGKRNVPPFKGGTHDYLRLGETGVNAARKPRETLNP
jgi:hypothetical protein